MAKTQEIAQIEEINSGLNSLNATLSNTATNYLRLVKTIEDGNDSIKESAANLNLVAKVQKETSENTKVLDALSKQLAASEAKLKQLEDGRITTLIENKIAIQQQTKAITDKIKAEQAEEGSLVRMRQKLKELTEQYDKAGVRTKAAAEEINKLSREIGKAEEATNRHQRNVGNYSEAFGKFKGVIAELPGPLGSAMGAAEGLVTKFGAFGPVGLWIGGAILSIGAPLAAFFLKSEKGVEMLERKIAGFKASISVLVGELIKSGDKMTEAFDKPAKSTFWTAILSVFGPSLGALGARMDYAKVAAEEYTRKLQEMEDAERKLIVPRSISNQKIKEAMILYNDESKSLSVRINALREAIRLENETADIEISAQHSRVENLKVINEQKKQAGQLRDSDDLALQNAIAKENDLRTDSLGRQMRATTRVKSATEEIQKQYDAAAKKRIEDAQKVSDAEIKALQDVMSENEKFLKQKEDDRKSEKQAQDELWKWLETSDTDEIEKFNKNQEAKTKKTKEEADKQKKIEEDLKKAKLDFAKDALEGAFQFRDMAIQKELSALQVEKDAKLSNSKLTTEQRAKLEAEYTKKENALKAKQAQNEKIQALFSIALQTSVGAAKAVAESPLTGGMPFLAWVIAQGVLRAALVAARPVPKYAKGTQSAAQAGIFGEAGRELMFLRDGGVMMADKATYFEGSKFKGARIYSNPETERLIGASDRKIQGVSISDERILAGLKSVEHAIISKPTNIVDSENRIIGFKMSNHQTILLNRLTRS